MKDGARAVEAAAPGPPFQKKSEQPKNRFRSVDYARNYCSASSTTEAGILLAPLQARQVPVVGASIIGIKDNTLCWTGRESKIFSGIYKGKDFTSVHGERTADCGCQMSAN